MFKSFAAISKANVDFYSAHPVAHTVITVTSTIAALVVLNTAAKLAAHPQTVNIYYTKEES